MMQSNSQLELRVATLLNNNQTMGAYLATEQQNLRECQRWIAASDPIRLTREANLQAAQEQITTLKADLKTEQQFSLQIQEEFAGLQEEHVSLKQDFHTIRQDQENTANQASENEMRILEYTTKWHTKYERAEALEKKLRRRSKRHHSEGSPPTDIRSLSVGHTNSTKNRRINRRRGTRELSIHTFVDVADSGASLKRENDDFNSQ